MTSQQAEFLRDALHHAGHDAEIRPEYSGRGRGGEGDVMGAPTTNGLIGGRRVWTPADWPLIVRTLSGEG